MVKYFPAKKTLFYNEKGLLNKGSKVHALDGIDFTLDSNCTLGIVGESGCGKTALARVILLLIRPTSGKIYFEKKEITALSSRDFSKIRPNLQIVFQDPFSSLDPRMKAKDIVSEPLKIVTKDRNKVKTRIDEAFNEVGLSSQQLDCFLMSSAAGKDKE